MDSRGLEEKPEQIEEDDFYYLQHFSDEELAGLQEIYHKTPQEIEAALQDHPWVYRNFYSCQIAAKLCNAMYSYWIWLVMTTTLQAFSDVIAEGAKVDDSWRNYTIPAIIIDNLFFMVSFSSHKRAVYTSIEYLLGKSLKTQLIEEWYELEQNPGEESLRLIKLFAHESLKLTVNATAIIPHILAIEPYIGKWPVWAKLPLQIASLGPGVYFCIHFWNKQYHLGFNHFFNNKDKHSLWRDENLSTIFQTLFQTVSNTGFFIIFYYTLSILAQAAVGFWLPPIMIAILTAFMVLCIYYPSSYNYYTKDHREITALINEHILPMLEDYLANPTVEKLDNIKKMLGEKLATLINQSELSLDKILKIYQDKILRDEYFASRTNNYRYIHPSLLFPATYIGGVGGYIGWTVTQQIPAFPIKNDFAQAFTTSLVDSLLVAMGALICNFSSVLADMERIDQQQINKYLRVKLNKTNEQHWSTREKIANVLGLFVNVISVVLNSFSTVAGWQSTFGSSTFGYKLALEIIMIANFYSAFNNLEFNLPDTQATMRELLAPRKTKKPKNHGWPRFYQSVETKPEQGSVAIPVMEVVEMANSLRFA